MQFRLVFALLLITPFVVIHAQETEESDRTSDDLLNEEQNDEDLEFDENGVPKLKPSPNANTHFLFTKPDGLVAELPSGKEVQFLVGFKNQGKQDFVVESLGASFRYLKDYSYHIQNFSAIHFNRLVKPSEEATFAYSFLVSDQLAERSFGFLANLKYRDASGRQFADAVFNKTMQIVEFDDGLNFETLFIYFFLVSIVFGIFYTIYSYFFSKVHFTKAKKVETGTTTTSDKIDYEWIPDSLNSRNGHKNTSKANKKTKKDN